MCLCNRFFCFTQIVLFLKRWTKSKRQLSVFKILFHDWNFTQYPTLEFLNPRNVTICITCRQNTSWVPTSRTIWFSWVFLHLKVHAFEEDKDVVQGSTFLMGQYFLCDYSELYLYRKSFYTILVILLYSRLDVWYKPQHQIVVENILFPISIACPNVLSLYNF